MVRPLLRNGQITLPKQAVAFFQLKEKDLLQISVDRSGIHIRPLLPEEFSSAEYTKLAARLDTLKSRGRRKLYGSTQDVRRHLDRLMRP